MPWVDVTQAAFMLGVSERTIRSWVKEGKLQARTTDGRHEIEVPLEPPQAAEPIDETQALTPQKRLEIALVECGRIRGTLTSQERMIDSLSSNVSELHAKLHHSQSTIAARTIFCLLVAFLGVIAYLLSSAYGQSRIHEERQNAATQSSILQSRQVTDIKALTEQYRQDLETIRKENAAKIAALAKTHAAALKSATRSQQSAATELRNKLLAEKQQDVAALTEKLNKAEQDLTARAKELENASASRDAYRKRLKAAEELFRKMRAEIERQRGEIEKLRTAYKETEATNARLRQQLLSTPKEKPAP